MEQFFTIIMRNAWVVLAAFLAAGAGLALIGASLPAVVLFLLAGLLMMYLSGQQAAARTPSGGDTDAA